MRISPLLVSLARSQVTGQRNAQRNQRKMLKIFLLPRTHKLENYKKKKDTTRGNEEMEGNHFEVQELKSNQVCKHEDVKSISY